MKNIFTLLFSLMFIVSVSAIGTRTTANEEMNKVVTVDLGAAQSAITLNTIKTNLEMKVAIVGYSQVERVALEKHFANFGHVEILVIDNLDEGPTVLLEPQSVMLIENSPVTDKYFDIKPSKFIDPPLNNYRR